MEIFNRAPSISEDTIHYRLYPLKTEVHDKASAATLAAYIHSLVQSLLPPEFLWHRDTFEIKVVHDTDTQGWFCEGHMRVGDCVDDEWCVVWLLREISSKWDLAISVNDTDGEFMLIEAADALPSWVKPSNSENRVWIYNSQLHLIDLTHVSAPSKVHRKRRVVQDSDDEDKDSEDDLVVEDALKLLRDPIIDTSAPSAVRNIVWQRISQYPSAARQHVHFTKAYLPQDIVKALHVDPSLIQKAVEAFYTRDAIQLRAAHRMSRFSPNTSVLATVKMTRTAYAQLLGQKFYPPKIFGRWQENEGTNEWRWRDVGMKIAVGFEMLYQESKGRSETINRTPDGLKSMSDSIKEHLANNPDYQTYIQKLASLDYFRGELKGSQLWNELEDKAISVFLSSQKQDDATRPSFTSLVSSAISRAPEPLPESTRGEDDDSWLNIDAESFEDALAKAQSNKTADPDAMDVDKPSSEMTEEDRVASEQASKLRDLAAKVEEFVEGEGDLEGARFKDEIFSDEEMSDDDASEEEQEPQRDPQQRQADMDKLVPGLEPGDYGKMPASFHSNSQKTTKTTLDTDDVSEDSSNTQTAGGSSPSKPIRKPILPRDKFDGVDSDDETDEDDDEEEEEEDERPQVVGEIEVDMQEEEDEFLEFSRQALGITDDQWKSILADRQDRGAYVPKDSRTDAKNRPTKTPASNANARTEMESVPESNPNLDSFEALMKAMDSELRRSTGATADKGKGKERARDDDVDIEAMMAEELQGALERDDDDEDSGLGDANVDYNLIKNFLESFKSQGGLSGPVGNLAGRLEPGWKLPRDEGGGHA
ncbi:hypothetical protein PQX77_004800 [Marasmius sp. AFHP31]|nr:hypothetical protein PQX77_004800 [Marasmius sp. AFHP31]